MRLDVRVFHDVDRISYCLKRNAVFSKEIKRTVHSQAVNLGQHFWETVPVFLRLINKKCACVREAQHDEAVSSPSYSQRAGTTPTDKPIGVS